MGGVEGGREGGEEEEGGKEPWPRGLAAATEGGREDEGGREEERVEEGGAWCR